MRMLTTRHRAQRLAFAAWFLLAAGAQAVLEEACPALGSGIPAAGTAVTISQAPRIYQFDGFLSEAESAHLRSTARELGVFAPAPQDPQDSQDSRGYHQEYIDEESYARDPIVSALDDRIAKVAHIPPDPGAGATISLAVRNASEPGLTNLHHDHNAAAMALLPFVQQGRKVPLTELQATLLGYVDDVAKGGETIFPCVCDRASKSCKKLQAACKYLYEHGVLNVHQGGHNTPFNQAGQQPAAREKLKKAAKYLVAQSTALCTGESSEGLKVAPRAGRAILFFSNSLRGFADPRAWHGSCRVVEGQKLAMQRFLYAPQGDGETGEHARAMFNW